MSKPGERTTFCQTLFWCACYFVVVMGLGVIGQIALNSPLWFVAIVAVISFLAALGFSSRTKYFQKDAVDFFYYSVGVLGVVLIFSSQGVDRIEVSEHIAVRELEEKSDRAIDALDAFEKDLPRLQTIFEAINADPAAFLGEVQRIRSEIAVRLSSDEAQSCWQSMTGRTDFGIRQPPDESGTITSRMRDAAYLAIAKAVCEQATERVAKERARIAALPLTLEDIKSDANVTEGIEKYKIHLGGESVPLGISVNALLLISDPTELVARREGLEQVQRDARSAYEDRRGKIDQIIRDFKAHEGTISGLLRFHYWPYVLILLLSLKLSRRRA